MQKIVLLLIVYFIVFVNVSASGLKEIGPATKLTGKFLNNNFQSLQDEINQLKSQLTSAVVLPSGAVVAFNLDACPDGWSIYKNGESRLIVGAGRGNGLTARIIGDTGGAETHLLSVSEMPAHNHGGTTGNVDNKVDFPHRGVEKGRLSGDLSFSTLTHSHSIQTQGNSVPHNNMPPFVVLKYCVKN